MSGDSNFKTWFSFIIILHSLIYHFNMEDESWMCAPHHAILCKMCFVLFCFFQFWRFPVVSLAPWQCTMTDTVVIMFIIRNLVPSNWTLPADNMFRQMWCIQMRKCQGTRNLLMLAISMRSQQPLSHFSTRQKKKRMNALSAGCWGEPCFLPHRVPNTCYMMIHTGTSSSSSNCDGLLTNVQTRMLMLMWTSWSSTYFICHRGSLTARVL